MITRHPATKERARFLLTVLRRNAHRLVRADYEALHAFLLACKARLPRRAMVAAGAGAPLTTTPGAKRRPWDGP